MDDEAVPYLVLFKYSRPKPIDKKRAEEEKRTKIHFFLFFLWIKWNEMERRFSVVLERYYIFLSLCHWKSNRFQSAHYLLTCILKSLLIEWEMRERMMRTIWIIIKSKWSKPLPFFAYQARNLRQCQNASNLLEHHV